MKKNRRPALLILSVIASVVVALAGAASLLETARAVDVVMLVAGSFGAGASMVAAVHEYRASGRTPRRGGVGDD